MPVFTHALLLRAGRVLAAGAKGAALTSESISRAFDAKLRLVTRKARWELTFADR